MKYQIGYKFQKSTGVRRDVCTIIDYLTTKNIKGDVVSNEYIISYRFLDNVVTETCPVATITRGIKL
jgi:hypothetical protein